MTETIPHELLVILEDLQKAVSELSARVATLEGASVSPEPAVAEPNPPAAPARETITDEELLAISGALAAYLGVRVHIRQIRLISSRAWASEGRVSIQASHRLHS